MKWFLIPAGSVALIAAARIRRRFLYVTVHGESMAPTFTGGERLLVRKQANVGSIRPGDIVVVNWSTVDDHDRPFSVLLVKRVALIAGDPLPALIAAAAGQVEGAPTPPGRFAVLGDNLEGSLDSRACGLFGAEDLVGVMVHRWR